MEATKELTAGQQYAFDLIKIATLMGERYTSDKTEENLRLWEAAQSVAKTARMKHLETPISKL